MYKILPIKCKEGEYLSTILGLGVVKPIIVQCNNYASHGTIEPFAINLFWSNKHETP